METIRRVMQQLFILSIATLAVSTSSVIFVKPTNETYCPQQPCHTLQHYAQTWQLHLTSGTVVQFLPGEHVLEGDWYELAVENISNLTLIGSDSVIVDSSGIPMATSRISCRRGKPLFSFYNVTELFLRRLKFSECGGTFFYNVSRLIADSINIQNSTGTGLIGINVRRSLIHHSTFVFNQAISTVYCSGNIMLFYTKCSEMMDTYRLNISSSWILFGNTMTSCPSGLSLYVGQSCYSVRVHIHNSTLKNNVGGNMFLFLNSIAHNIITIAGSHFEGGRTSGFGGGLLINTSYNASNISQHVQNNVVYVNNTVFVGNHASSGGAMAVVSCTGTDLHINGSKFHSNVAYFGGHIAIGLVSRFQTCANVTITISESLFKDGNATMGSGGGVAVQGTYSTSQCTNGNHISFSKVRFVENYAEHSGGALALWGCIGTVLHIDDSEFYNNTTPLDGGHIALELDYVLFLIVNNSHFESGKAQTGGGIAVFLMAGGKCTSVSSTVKNCLYIMNSKVYRNVAKVGGGVAVEFNQSCFASNLVYFNNTEFSENHAKSGPGGAIEVMPCTGTELHINGSKFHSNVAYFGGHVAIGLVSRSQICTNITITISESLFKDGNATRGGGGGVAVWGTYITSQCSNGNHISFSKVRFVGNYADHSGGAVALWGCIGTVLHIDLSEFNNNTTPLDGGHIALRLLSLDHVILNNSHFESGKAHIGGGIAVFATDGGRCTSVSGTVHKYVYIMNSKVHQNVATFGGGVAVEFNQNCLPSNVLIHNVSLSRNTATIFSGGNIYVINNCSARNSLIISSTTVEFGNSSGNGGGMTFLTAASEACSSTMVNLKPTTVNIVNSSVQYNTAHYQGGGLVISFNSSNYSCCSAKVDITNVTFLNNKVSTFPFSNDDKELLPTEGGNIYIQDISGQWLNNSVRIHSCLIKGGVAILGGGVYLTQTIKYSGSSQKSTTMESLLISNTQFTCNRATGKDSFGASLAVDGQPGDYNAMWYSMSPTIKLKRLTITDTIFDGTCADSSNIDIIGLGWYAPYLPTWYSVVFVNVSFQGYSSLLSTFHPQQLSDSSLDDDFIQYLPDPQLLRVLQPAVTLISVQNATFIDCEFVESTADSALYARSTNVFFGGNITFRDNIATRGAGMMLIDSSVMYLRPNTHLMFSHNHATYVGGAIYAQSVDTRGNARCFYQFDEMDQDTSELNINVKFENNTAYFAGSALYGGSIDFCTLQSNAGRNISFDSIFKVKNTKDDPTAISSNPYKVCLCENSKPVCDNQNYFSWYTYPGARFQVQAVLVGQKDGIVPGVVRATLRNTSAVLVDLQHAQATGKSCTALNYTVFSSNTQEQIVLVNENIGRNLITVTQPEIVLNVTLLSCPWGFTLTGAQPKCDCVDKLRKHHIYSCNITTQTISRPPPLWIGYYHSDNNSEHPVEGVLVHDNCPFDYCKPEQLSIQLNDSDKQCALNHSGILCGTCQLGLSLALGTSICLKCSNIYLTLLFAFAAAGLALVFVLTLTNMTVSEGTINGLIFYANIIHINRAIFFINESAGIQKVMLNILSTFISWINLDLGIETCFYNGMDMYTKAWLQFLFPIYIWTIVAGMIASSHYSTTAAKLFRRHAVKVLATLFLLSFAKLQRTIITALSFTFLTYPDGTKTVWLYDSNIEYLRGKHVPLFIAALVALLFVLLPYTLVLFFIQCLPKLDYQIFYWARKLKPLFDAYTGPYKDKYRFWTGFLLIIRTILFLIFTLGNPGLNLAAISITSTCLAFTPAVYKKVWLTVLEYSLLLNLSATSVATFYCRDPQFSGNQAVVVYISVGTALLTFIGMLVYHLYQCTITSRPWKTVSDRVTQKNKNRELVNIAAEGSDEEEEEPPQAEIRPLILRFNEDREPVLVFDDED